MPFAGVHALEELTDLELLKDESGGLLYEEGISTISFFEGGDFGAASQALKTQFGQVVGANPWLAGKLVNCNKKVVLRHPKVVAKDSEHLSALMLTSSDVLSKLPPKSSYIEMCTALSNPKNGITVGTGYGLVDKNAPVALLTFARTSDEKMAMVFSMSHAIGDGRTYYEVLKMLTPGAQVRSLVTQRVMDFSDKMRAACGRRELEWADKPSVQLMYTVAMLPAKLGCKGAKCFAFELDEARVAADKAAAASGDSVSFVSTNDVITSGFFTATGARIGMMGMDCRGKIDGVSGDMAGNYVTALVLDGGVFESPRTLRQMYASQPYQGTKRPLPGLLTSCGNSSFAMVTNWSSFAGDLVSLPGCELKLHLPVKNPAYCLFDLMIPFRSSAGKQSVICWTTGADEDKLRKALPVGSSVSKDLFP